MQTNSTKAIEVAKKIAALAEKGSTPGERNAAKNLLHDFLKKNGLTLSDLESEIKRSRTFFLEKGNEEKATFFAQVFRNVVGYDRDLNTLTEYGRKSNRLKPGKYFVVEITDAEYLEIDAKFRLYWNHWEKERKFFYSAFIQENELYTKRTDNDPEPVNNLSAEDYRRIQELMWAVEKKSFHKQLNK